MHETKICFWDLAAPIFGLKTFDWRFHMTTRYITDAQCEEISHWVSKNFVKKYEIHDKGRLVHPSCHWNVVTNCENDFLLLKLRFG